MFVLAIYKTVMYDRYYFMKNLFDNKLYLLMMDTDSLMYENWALDPYKELLPYVKDTMDTSNHPENYPSRIP